MKMLTNYLIKKLTRMNIPSKVVLACRVHQSKYGNFQLTFHLDMCTHAACQIPFYMSKVNIVHCKY